MDIAKNYNILVMERKDQEIAAKFKQGVPRERILDDIRESLSQELARHYLIARRHSQHQASSWSGRCARPSK